MHQDAKNGWIQRLTYVIEIDDIKVLHPNNGVFAFYRNNRLVRGFEPFDIKAPNEFSKRSYHFDHHNLAHLEERFPDAIPVFDETLETRRAWSDRVRVGLCEIIRDGKLSFEHIDDQGNVLEASIRWCGEAITID
ncbi:hypothetical protein ACQKD4_06170 [Exiguobacterium sp. NPDC077395]|uniref:hypothetical protein n=1 Tax=Exiguobacterium sp. NPDC077395 TaxID=3390563 RepID=UPI003CFF35E7